MFALPYGLQGVRPCLSRLTPLRQGGCRPCTPTQGRGFTPFLHRPQPKELPPEWPTNPPRLPS
jgi:hypothetical protein